VQSLGDNAVELLVHVWTPRTEWWTTKMGFTKRVKEAFDREGVSIPFPQRDVHLIDSRPAAN